MWPHHHTSAGRWLGVLICLTLVAGATFNPKPVGADEKPRGRAASPKYSPRSFASLGNLALSFEDNRGQAGRQFDVLSRGHGATLLFNYSGASVILRRRAENKEGRAPGPVRHRPQPAPATMVLKLVGADARARIEKTGLLAGKSNYLIGRNPKLWRTNIANYGKLSYANVYPGIDITYYGNRRQLEYDFIVRPGGNPSAIAVEFAGAEKVELDAAGDLRVRLGGGEVLQRKPFVYQEVDGVGRAVSGSYVLKGGNRVGFEVGSYDRRKPLVIDPVLVYSTYLGGGGDDQGIGVALDSAGKAYITGVTSSTSFPVTAGAAQATKGGGSDIFVTKLNAAGTAAVYSTYIGGVGGDEGLSIAVDLAGSAYVTGLTNSPDFPVTQGSLQTTHGGGATDAFVVKLDAVGAGLTYATYLGGNLDEEGYGLAVDTDGKAYVAGVTDSANFPTHAGFQTAKNAGSDAFLAKLNFGGTALSYSTFVGGGGLDWGFAVSADASGNAYLAGATNSSDFPTSTGSLQAAPGSNGDGFVTKANTNAVGAASLAYSTYLGGGGLDLCGGVAVDLAGNAYVTGLTASTNFPTAGGAPQTAAGGGGGDAFVSKLHANGSSLLYSTYLGGGGTDWGRGVAVDTAGQAYVVGSTESANFPVVGGAFQTSSAGRSDAFISKLNAAGTGLVYSSYLGGAGSEDGYGVGIDLAGNAFVVGTTSSNNLPVTQGAFQPARAGGADAFAAQVSRQEVGQPANQIDDVTFFVRQHYLDFLGRAADPDGLAFWTNDIEKCGADAQCREVKRINVSAAFFLSIEFQETGYLVYRFYKAAYGDLPGAPVPLRREEFLPDAQRIGLGVRVGIGDWRGQLETNKTSFSQEFVARARFTNNYPANMTPAEFVNKLNQNTGNALTQAEAGALAQELAAAGNTAVARASTLRKVAEHAEVVRREFNRAFVLMQYSGYLRRSPDDSPDTDFSGFNFWLGKLNEFNGNFINAEMVKAFLSSLEYRRRFGTP